jgi:hypothetical protein
MASKKPEPKKTTKAAANGDDQGEETTALARREEAELVEPVPDEVIGEVVKEIYAIGRDVHVRLAIGVGEVILRRFCGGSFEEYQRRGPKDNSLRKLADKLEELGLPDMGVSYLQRAVGIYDLSERLPVSTWQHLTPSHYRVVLNLPEEKQMLLLTKANDEKLTVEKLAKAAEGTRQAVSDGRGRPRQPTFQKTINLLGRLVSDDSDAFDELDQVETLNEKEVTELRSAVVAMKAKCAELEVRLDGWKAARPTED